MPLIGFVGRLCEVKNLPMLLDVARCLCDQGVTAKFVLIGDGDLRHDLRARVNELGLEGMVFFAGFRKDVLSLYADLDVVLLTSVNEGTPLTLIEAMAAGRAVASTEVGGVPDLMGRRRVVRRGFTIWDHGVTARSGDTVGLAKGLRYLIGDAPARQAMGERGKTFVRENYFTSRLIKDLMALYRELLA
jgi:glycosyltransferase involved in cell wall biosynthesis